MFIGRIKMLNDKKEVWLKQGLLILGEQGYEKLTLENLCNPLKLTKGSFYHHFKNRRVYIEELLKYWEKESTLKIIELSELGKTPKEKRKLLTKLTSSANKTYEIAIRAWAFQDDLVKEYQTKVDKQRIEYITNLSYVLTNDKEKANLLSKLLYALFVGSYYIFPNLQPEELQKIYFILDEKFLGE